MYVSALILILWLLFCSQIISDKVLFMLIFEIYNLRLKIGSYRLPTRKCLRYCTVICGKFFCDLVLLRNLAYSVRIVGTLAKKFQKSVIWRSIPKLGRENH